MDNQHLGQSVNTWRVDEALEGIKNGDFIGARQWVNQLTDEAIRISILAALETYLLDESDEAIERLVAEVKRIKECA